MPRCRIPRNSYRVCRPGGATRGRRSLASDPWSVRCYLRRRDWQKRARACAARASCPRTPGGWSLDAPGGDRYRAASCRLPRRAPCATPRACRKACARSFGSLPKGKIIPDRPFVPSAPARGLIEGSDPLRVVLEVAGPGLVRRVRREPLGRLAATELPHLLPQRNGSARIVARARGELHADAIGLGFVDPRMRQRKRNLKHGLRQLSAQIAEPKRCAEHADPDLLGHLLARAFTPVLAQRVRDLVPHYGSQLFVRRIQFRQETGIDGDLAAGHAPRVRLGRGDHVDLPVPARRIGAERCRVRDQTPCYGTRPLDLSGIPVELVFLAGF